MTMETISYNPRIEKVQLRELIPYDKNPNKMSAAMKQSLDYSVKKYSPLQLIVIDQNNNIIDGHHRQISYMEQGIREADVIRVDIKTEKERRLLAQTLNKVHGEHDPVLDAEDILLIINNSDADRLEYMRLTAQQDEKSLFELINQNKKYPKGETKEENLEGVNLDPELITEPVAKTGDIWQLGNHFVICGDCTDKDDVMVLLDDKRPNLIVTSPPYDSIRSYDNNYTFDVNALIDNLYEITSGVNGVIVWVTADQTNDGDESGTSLETALAFKKKGFKLHDTMIYGKIGQRYPASTRYKQVFEYMFVFVNGKLETFNPITDVKNIHAGEVDYYHDRNFDGEFKERKPVVVKDYRARGNIWEYAMIDNTNKIATQHPAIFPTKLAYDHIISWTNEGDFVMDPFCGSGTTIIACEQSNRNGLGIEINPKYVDIIVQRWEAFTGRKAERLDK